MKTRQPLRHAFRFLNLLLLGVALLQASPVWADPAAAPESVHGLSSTQAAPARPCIVPPAEAGAVKHDLQQLLADIGQYEPKPSSAVQPSKRALTPSEIPPGEQEAIDGALIRRTLGLPESTSVKNYKKGGYNRCLDLKSADPKTPTTFPSDDYIPPKLRGKKVDGYKSKVMHAIADDEEREIVQARDEDVYHTTNKVLEADHAYPVAEQEFEGLELEETFFMKDPETGDRVLVQHTSPGESYEEFMRRKMGKTIKDYDSFVGMDFMQAMINTPEGWELAERMSVRGGPKLQKALQDANNHVMFRRLMHDPEVKRVITLLKRLKNLEGQFEIAGANMKYQTHCMERGGMFCAMMPWSEPQLNGSPKMKKIDGADLNIKNFKIYKAPDGRLKLRIFDF